MSNFIFRWIDWAVIGAAGLPLCARPDHTVLSASVLRVRAYNFARVGRTDLTRAEREAAAIFAEAGIITRWSEGSPQNSREYTMDFSANGASSGSCNAANRSAELSLQLIRGAPRNTFPGALGFALPCAYFGVLATVFVDRCEEAMYQMLASFPKVLAHVMTHEIGDVLLGSNERSKGGIMSGRWTKAEWQIVAVSHMLFLPQQVGRMRRELSVLPDSNETADLTAQSVR